MCDATASKGERLGWLTRFPAAAISALGVEPNPVKGMGTLYCRRCVFLNPLEVESPYWKRDWLLPTASVCPSHNERLTILPHGSEEARTC